MVKVTFPDGSVREFAKGTTAFQVAESISPRLAADSLAAEVNGATVDMMRAIDSDCTIKFFKWDDAEGKHAFWHTSSHLLAEALEALYPGIKFGIGPAIDIVRRRRAWAEWNANPLEHFEREKGRDISVKDLPEAEHHD